MSQYAVSPLRYPGGKSRAIKTIVPLLPKSCGEFREPFVGGGSVFLAAKQSRCPHAAYVINDLNYDLYCFWRAVKESNTALREKIIAVKKNAQDGKTLFASYRDNSDYTDIERAVRFFILNRITFSGTVDSGGYSEKAFLERFTDSSIERIKPLETVLQNVTIHNQSYEELIFADGNDVFIFLDPPYYRQAGSRLYGKKGCLHTGFDHEKFARDMKQCSHRWLITLDNTDVIKSLFDFAYIYEWELQYGMNNYKQGKADVGKELFISNYRIPLLEQKETGLALFGDYV